MPITLGIDAGTTTITALALDTERREVLGCATAANDAEVTAAADRARGRSEWDAARIATQARAVVRSVAETLGARAAEVDGIAFTGQQHGVVVVDERLEPLTPFINWQDRRGDEEMPGTGASYAERAAAILGLEGARRAGCRLSTGFLGTTLFWLKETGALPTAGTACFLMDYLGASLAGVPPVTDPTLGASSGLFDLARRAWAEELIAALGLPRGLFPAVREAGALLGRLTPAAAEATGLRAGVPVFVGLGDNQASFLGSVARLEESLLVNVGTGAQVGAYVERILDVPPLETRPFPCAGYLLVHAGLSGGRSYALLRRFFEQVGAQVLGESAPADMYARMNALAAGVPHGAGGVRCEPFFAGSREEPDRRAVWSGISAENFTPAHLTRALLEGMARAFHEGANRIQEATGASYGCLVGAGNGIRENPTLARVMAEEFGQEMSVPAHREEAAFGAALVAGVGAGVWPDLAAAGEAVRYR